MVLRYLLLVVGVVAAFSSAEAQDFWQKVASPLDSAGKPFMIAPYFARQGHALFGLSARGVYRSEDHGVNWYLVSNQFSGTWIEAFAETSSGALLAGGPNFTTYRSTDRGVTWLAVSGLPTLPVKQFWADRSPYLFAGIANGGVYRSDNDGVSWHEAAAGLPSGHWGQSLTRLANGDLLVSTGLSGEYSVYRSSNDGESWERSDSGLGATLVWVLSKTNDGAVLAGGMKKGAFRSTDNGRTWANSSRGFVDSTKADVQVLIADGAGVMYASSGFNSGPHRSTDGGRNWEWIGSGLDIQDFGHLTIDDDGYLYLGSGVNVYRAAAKVSPVLAVKLSEEGRATGFPNPVERELFVLGDPGCKWEIYDALGKRIRTGVLSESQSVPVNDLPSGAYALRFGGKTVRFIR